jgi:hypothetical protein
MERFFNGMTLEEKQELMREMMPKMMGLMPKMMGLMPKMMGLMPKMMGLMPKMMGLMMGGEQARSGSPMTGMMGTASEVRIEGTGYCVGP